MRFIEGRTVPLWSWDTSVQTGKNRLERLPVRGPIP
jgi:hypothetical protein